MPRTTRRGPKPFSRRNSRSNRDEVRHMKKFPLVALTAILALAAPAAAQVKLTGAGATFPTIIYQDWMLSYNQTHPDVQLNYQSIGSGGGIRQFSDGTVDFGATDAPMKDSAITAINGNVLHIPTVLGGDVPTYNLPEVKETLRFTPDVLADIFLGKITKWSDARVAPLRDLAEEDVREHVRGEPQRFLHFGEVIGGDVAAEHRGDVEHVAIDRRDGGVLHRCIARPEVHGAVGELADAPARSDRLVVQLYVGVGLIVRQHPILIDDVG